MRFTGTRTGNTPRRQTLISAALTMVAALTRLLFFSALLASGCGGSKGLDQDASADASGVTRAASGKPTVISITFPDSVKRNQIVPASALLTTVDGRAVGGRQVTFYVLTTSRYDYAGRRATGNDGTAKTEINTANLSPGKYFLAVEFEGAGSYGKTFPARTFTTE